MGGRVFKEKFNGGESLRMDLYTYRSVLSDIMPLFPRKDECPQALVPERFKDKINFGDIDIVLSNNYYDSKKIINILKSKFGDNITTKVNGPIVHFLYKDKYQVDFILSNEPVFTWYYLSYSVGMILGIIYRHLGFSLTMEGVKTRHSDVVVTTDWDKAMRFIGFYWFDEFHYNNKTPTEQEAFEQIWNIHFVSKKLFEDSLASCKHRKREADSKTFKRFFEYISQLPEKSQSDYPIDISKWSEYDKWDRAYNIFGSELMLKVEEKIAWKNYCKEVLDKREREHFSYYDFLEIANKNYPKEFTGIEETDNKKFGPLFKEFKTDYFPSRNNGDDFTYVRKPRIMEWCELYLSWKFQEYVKAAE